MVKSNLLMVNIFTRRRYEDARDHGASIKGQILGLIQDNYVQRPETNQLHIAKSCAVVLNSEAWDKENTGFADDELLIIASQLETPLRNAELTGST